MKTKIAIGCLVQWYEIKIIPEYVESLKQAIKYYDSDKDIYVHFRLTVNTQLEKCMVGAYALAIEIRDLIQEELGYLYSNLKIDLDIEEYSTIADYRRTFNENYCNKVDFLVWGESDMLVPKEMFSLIHQMNTQAEIPMTKYIITFGICKMWDSSWKHLEHPKFTDKPFIEGDNKNWWSLRYNMSLEEMNNINSETKDLDIKVFSKLKFNGCGLVISSEVVKAGVTIPKSVFFIHEDTAFMKMCERIIPNIKQVHISNILLVHNRKHPKKRSYIVGEEVVEDKSDLGKLRKTHAWYPIANKMCEENVYRLFDNTYKSFTWQDVWEAVNKNNTNEN